MSRPINLMQILYTLDIGGLEYLVLNLSKKINKERFKLSICCLNQGGLLEEKFKELSIPVYHVLKKPGIDFSLYYSLARLFKEKEIDIIHTHNPAPWFYGAVAAKLAGVKGVVHTEHSSLFADQKKMMFAERILSMFTDIVISDSEKVTSFLVNKIGMNKKNVVTVVNGIDLSLFGNQDRSSEKKASLGIADNCPIIGNVARLEPVKNHCYLLDVFYQVCQHIPNALLVIVGDGSQSQNLHDKAIELGIEDNVIFLGARNDIPELLGIFNIFALTSINEGVSLSLLEAMAAGKPIVATRVGGNSDVIVEGVTGFLFALNKPKAMADCIVKLLKDRDLSIKTGDAGLERVKCHFSLDKMVDKYEEIYQQVFSIMVKE